MIIHLLSMYVRHIWSKSGISVFNVDTKLSRVRLDHVDALALIMFIVLSDISMFLS